jgi:DNA-binding CsgD family transcriptional regulator
MHRGPRIPIHTPEEISKCEQNFTPRQERIMDLLCEGVKSDRKLSEAMGIREQTVRCYLAACFEISGMSSRRELRAWWEARRKERENGG